MTAPALRGGDFEHDGCRFAYLASGAGPSVLFLHGGLARGSSWVATTDLLGDAFTCYLLDQRGHGASDWGGGPDVARAVEDVFAFLRHVGPVAGVVAHSYGALVALEAAQLGLPGEPRLVLYEPPLPVAGPLMEEATLRDVRAAVDAGEHEAALLRHITSAAGGMSATEIDALRANPLFRSAYADLVIQAPSIAAVAAINRLDDASRYAEVGNETLVLLGSESPHHPFGASAEALVAAMPSCRIEVLAGQTHLALLLAPHLVAEATRRGLAQPAAR